VPKHSGDILKHARYSAGSSAYSSIKSNADPPCVLLLANHLLTHAFFALAISSSSTSAIYTSSNLNTFLTILLHFFLSSFTFDSFETMLNPPLEVKLVDVCERYLLRYLLRLTCNKSPVHLPCLYTGLV
jgi:hypothetical protein